MHTARGVDESHVIFVTGQIVTPNGERTTGLAAGDVAVGRPADFPRKKVEAPSGCEPEMEILPPRPSAFAGPRPENDRCRAVVAVSTRAGPG